MDRVDYRITGRQLTEQNETAHQVRKWQLVQQQQAGETALVRLALHTLPYVTSYELPFRLLLIRAPQAVDRLRMELTIYSRRIIINGSGWGMLYSLKRDVAAPMEFHYMHHCTAFRSCAEGGTENRYRAVARQVNPPRERVRLALVSGLVVTALDALLFFGVQRLASDIAVLRQSGMKIALLHVMASDTQTGRVRQIPAYRLVSADGSAVTASPVI